ncbi:D-glycerate dehydrogenase [Virgibacillus sp. YIM 98842]|uniref:2-hydroxyacid dehydrogenase n=1 Tax=Virgibacillus sp. YIM 98842 TaxID=2663533 RepID=UPI0013DA4E50|nr:D-glycerate dehydrogenase [Virgibacillus sp. YIM 98842]
MKKKIIAYNRVEKPVLDELKEKYDVRFFNSPEPINDPAFLEQLKEAEGIIGLELPVNKELLDHAPNLKIVSNVSVGYNNLDLDELKKRNIMATNTPDVLNDTVADTVFGILLAGARRITELDRFVKNGKWQQEAVDPEYFGVDVHHKKIGIIGLGSIGWAIANRAHFGFHMDVLYHTRSRKIAAEETFAATYCALPKLLEESDFVCMMTPLTKETEGMIGLEEFKRMKDTAIFINASRGKTVVEKELIQALQKGEIAGAALDVFENEPIETDSPLLQMENVVTTPHIGSSTHETELKMSKLAAANLEAGLNGKKPQNLIWE